MNQKMEKIKEILENRIDEDKQHLNKELYELFNDYVKSEKDFIYWSNIIMNTNVDEEVKTYMLNIFYAFYSGYLISEKDTNKDFKIKFNQFIDEYESNKKTLDKIFDFVKVTHYATSLLIGIVLGVLAHFILRYMIL